MPAPTRANPQSRCAQRRAHGQQRRSARACFGGPAPEEGAGGGVAVFLVEEGGGGFLAEGFGGGEDASADESKSAEHVCAEESARSTATVRESVLWFLRRGLELVRRLHRPSARGGRRRRSGRISCGGGWRRFLGGGIRRSKSAEHVCAEESARSTATVRESVLWFLRRGLECAVSVQRRMARRRWHLVRRLHRPSARGGRRRRSGRISCGGGWRSTDPERDEVDTSTALLLRDLATSIANLSSAESLRQESGFALVGAGI
jgi:hypothetical protein